MPTDRQRIQLVEEFRDRLLQGDRFERIAQARKVAAEVWGETIKPGSKAAKETEEVFEQGLVRAGRAVIEDGQQQGQSTSEIYDRLVDLYERQPRLGTKSSTSILRQQYSTPIPVAYLASQLAGIEPGKQVYEPTAGHGALLMECSPSQAIANELDENRAADLRRQGYNVTQQDATDYQPSPRSADLVIANPPFGRRKQDGRSDRWKIGASKTQIQTSQIDQAIAWKALEAMTDDGKAILILGSERGDEKTRSDQYNSVANRGFYYNLYRNYNVTDHFTVDGGLYSRQGAGFPIDIIKISGRGESQRQLPAADVPRIYKTFDELKGVLTDVSRQSPQLETRNRERRSTNIQTEQFLRSATEAGADGNRRPGRISTTDDNASELVDEAVFGGRATRARTAQTDDSISTDPRRGGYSPSRDEFADGLGDRLGTASEDESDVDGDGLRLSSGTTERPGRTSMGDRRHLGSDFRGMAPVVHERLEQNGGEVMALEATEKQQTAQVMYSPRSRGPRLDTLIPRNMSSAASEALDNLEAEVGPIDEYVADKLNFPSVDSMHARLAAEQVDGVALSIRAMEKGQGALIGDQTGVGKGRQLASAIKYAKESGRTPVFVTRDAGLYADMMRDLEDVGVKDFKPFLTNSSEDVPLPNGGKLKTRKNSHQAELTSMLQEGKLSDAYDGVFTTYSQLQTVKGEDTDRRKFLNEIAPDSIFIFDESHEAGGSNQQRYGGPENRAEFARRLVDRAQGVVFASATAIKRPNVMDLYGRKTNMAEALGSVEALQSTLEAGGIPLQQTSTAMLTQDGSYTRREKSYEGVEFGIEKVPVDRESTDDLSYIMGQILQFDRSKQQAIAGLDKGLKAQAKALSEDSSIGDAGASSTNFTAVMHNVIDQSLLARKADRMADEAIASLKRGEKPVLTVSNTMGSFLEEFAKNNDLSPGDPVDANFSDILTRYLERSRDVVETNYDGSSNRRRLTDEELGPEGIAAYEQTKELIENTDLSFPVSPIDRIKQRIEEAGYSFGEITGRKDRVEYDGSGNAIYQKRSGYQTSKAAKVRTVNKFNSGQTDVVLLNRSGATGISLHASETFKNQDRRHMIVGQAERNVTDFMQTLGRVNRTGQTTKPKITLLMSDTPDEKRPAAVLEKKLASLNANTTASRQSGFDTSQIPDFFNEFGDQVVTGLLAEYPEINEKLAYPIWVSEDATEAEEGAIAKVTGRLPLMTVKEQEDFYQLLENEYNDYVEQQKTLGNNILEAQTVDLDAKTLARTQVIPPKSGLNSAFASGVDMELVDAKTQRRPKTQLEVVNELRSRLGMESVKSVEQSDPEAIETASTDYSRSLIDKAQKASAAYAQNQEKKIRDRIRDPDKRQGAFDKMRHQLEKQNNKLTQLNRFHLGRTVRLTTDKERVYYGAITNIQKRGKSLDARGQRDESSDRAFGESNPVAPSKWNVEISLADSARQIKIPLSKINTETLGAVTVQPTQKTAADEEIMELFDKRQSGQRERRQMMRGNLLVATEKFGSDGQIVNATMADQTVEPVLLFPKGYDIQQKLESQPVELPAPRNVRQFFELTQGQGIVKDSQELVTIKQADRESVAISTSKKNRDILFDSNLQSTMGTEFYSVGDRMEAVFDLQRLDDAIHCLQSSQQMKMQAVSHLDIARELTGQGLPTFEWGEDVEAVRERAGLPPEVDLSDLDNLHDRLESLVDLPDEQDDAQDAQATESATASDSSSQQSQQVARIGAWKQQSGRAEKYVGKFLNDAGLAEAVMSDEQFHVRIENEPYQPLSVERQGNQLMLTHYAQRGGDKFIDTEMVFNLREDGALKFVETAVGGPYGEARASDRSFATMFAKNINNQGFAEAAQDKAAQLEHEKVEQSHQQQDDSARSAIALAEAPEAETSSEVEDNTQQQEAIAAGDDEASTPSQVEDNAQQQEAIAAEVNEAEKPSQVEDDGQQLESIAAGDDEVQGVSQQQNIDYTETLARLRKDIATLPKTERSSLLSTLDRVEQNMQGRRESQPDGAVQQVDVGQFVQNLIKAQDPSLDKALADPENVEQPTPTVDEFRKWYAAARSLGQDKSALRRISAMGQAVKNDVPIRFSQSDAEQMHSDREQSQEQKVLGAEMASNAERFLARAVENGITEIADDGSVEMSGDRYQVELKGDLLSIENKNSGAVVVADREKGQIVRARGLDDRDRDRWDRLSKMELSKIQQKQEPDSDLER